MLEFKTTRDSETGEWIVETSIQGKYLLTVPQLNKGTAFTLQERQAFGLLGKLPHRVESIDEQVERAFLQYSAYTTHLQKNIYLNNLHDKNQVLFYKLLNSHLAEMLPIIYTPIVGTAVKQFSREYRQPRGLYLAHTDQDSIDEILSNRSNPEIDLIVVTDGEGVLGIGDQGVGGMDIPVAKLMVYSLCGGIDPTRTLPIFLDTGTNNSELLNDPFYLGCRHPRISPEKYDEFIHKFICSVKRNFPHAFLHWEDLGRNNARRILDKYQESLCTFNDDIQGTGAVTLAALLAACNITGLPLEQNRIVVYGAGSAGTGISDQIVDSFIRLGLSREEALARFWLIDKDGLLTEKNTHLTEAQKPYARKCEEIASWKPEGPYPSLNETLSHVEPTILIGCSAQKDAFSNEIIEMMCRYADRPIIFPLSNPDEKCEARPQNIMEWSKGKALIATGTPFEPVKYEDKIITIAQCNNALIFPGIGLGLIAVQATHLTKDMLSAAALALSKFSPSNTNSSLPLLPSLENAQEVAKHIAIAVAQVAIESGLATSNQKADLPRLIEDSFWQPRYLPFKKIERVF
ncbi:malate dehydrogenase (plasmid) [Legionella adelaidensis]|uniref:Malolactic enzyme n=1 Tax=Legionella adelaidensis TaxID=45056 RepID=A0A0W0R2C5_9GAMM|nr:NAD-dependent malic enzyme [Legionella adelaidensis]KTC65178.1 malate dehydrogenase [Legionella adelaidensis]VEH85072.1 malate dehydrogenase [Legionella adelaidensis]